MDDRDPSEKKRAVQLELPLGAPRAPKPLPPVTAPAPSVAPRGLRLIKGEGKKRDDTLRDRNDVARLLVSSAADMLLHRISHERAHEIEVKVDKIMRLFDRCEREPALMPLLRRELDDLEALWREGQEKRKPTRG